MLYFFTTIFEKIVKIKLFDNNNTIYLKDMFDYTIDSKIIML